MSRLPSRANLIVGSIEKMQDALSYVHLIEAQLNLAYEAFEHIQSLINEHGESRLVDRLVYEYAQNTITGLNMLAEFKPATDDEDETL